jgi:hypothetical protein
MIESNYLLAINALLEHLSAHWSFATKFVLILTATVLKKTTNSILLNPM